MLKCVASYDCELALRLPLQRAREILTELKRQMAGEGDSHAHHYHQASAIFASNSARSWPWWQARYVLKVQNTLIPRFRKSFREQQHKDLAVIVAGELIQPNAAKQGIIADASCYRAA